MFFVNNNNKLTRKRAAPADFNHLEARTFHPQSINHHDTNALDDTGTSQAQAVDAVPLTGFGDPAFVRFNHRAAAPAIVPEKAAPDKQGFMCRLAGTMMSSVLAALSGVGRKITHFFYNDPSYNIVERRNYDPRDGSWSNKRAKIRGVRAHGGDPEPPSSKCSPAPRWCDDEKEVEHVYAIGRHYHSQFDTLSKRLSEYSWYDCERDRLGAFQIVEQLKWIETGLYDSPEEIRPFHDIVKEGDSYKCPKPNHYTKLIQALGHVTTFLEMLYDFEAIRDIRNMHGAQVSHEYFHTTCEQQDSLFVRYGTTTKKLLSDEYFVAAIIYLNRALSIPPEARITRETVKHILLDITAIENNLPPPTYLRGDRAQLMYRIEIKSRFPLPLWMDLPETLDHPLESQYLPGKFPESPQHSRLRYDNHGRRKYVPYAATRPLPPPLSEKSGRGTLDSPSKSSDPEPRWHPINNGRVNKPFKRCKACRHLPYRCVLSGCGKSRTEPRRHHHHQHHSPEHLHSPHHRVVPAPPSIIKRSNRQDPSDLAGHIKNLGEKVVSFSSSTVGPPDLSSPMATTSQEHQQQLDQSLQHHFGEASGPADDLQLQSQESKESIAQTQEENQKELNEKAARELEQKLALTGGLRSPKARLIGDLPAEAVQRIRHTLHAAPTTSLATTGEGVELRRRDFAKVVPPTEWLNDEIVNGSLNWLDKAINSAAGIKNVRTQTRKCAVFSSFFFKMLRDGGAQKGVRPLGRMGIKRENFFQIETLLLPICENSHWTLLVIRPSKKTVSHMDSLNPDGNQAFIDLAFAWLKEFLQDDFVPEDWKTVQHVAPRQVNGWDCGVHIITNAMCLALGIDPMESYLAHEMGLQRLRVAGMLLNGGFHGDYSLQAF